MAYPPRGEHTARDLPTMGERRHFAPPEVDVPPTPPRRARPRVREDPLLWLEHVAAMTHSARGLAAARTSARSPTPRSAEPAPSWPPLTGPPPPAPPAGGASAPAQRWTSAAPPATTSVVERFHLLDGPDPMTKRVARRRVDDVVPTLPRHVPRLVRRHPHRRGPEPLHLDWGPPRHGPRPHRAPHLGRLGPRRARAPRPRDGAPAAELPPPRLAQPTGLAPLTAPSRAACRRPCPGSTTSSGAQSPPPGVAGRAHEPPRRPPACPPPARGSGHRAATTGLREAQRRDRRVPRRGKPGDQQQLLQRLQPRPLPRPWLQINTTSAPTATAHNTADTERSLTSRNGSDKIALIEPPDVIWRINMRIPVPSWVAAAVGASVVAYTTTMGARSIALTDANIQTLSQSIVDAKQQYETDRLTHIQATTHEAYADLNFGAWTTCLALGAASRECVVPLEHAGSHFLTAVGLLAQTTGVSNEDYQPTFEKLDTLVDQLHQGKEEAYDKLRIRYGHWRFKSMETLDSKRAAFTQLEKQRDQCRAQRESHRTNQLTVTLWVSSYLC